MLRAVSGRVAYANAWMRVREDGVERPDGSRGVYGVVEKPDFALVIPYESGADGGAVWLVEQYRYPVGLRRWEFPQGSWDDPLAVPGSRDPADLARAELAEETGLRAGAVRHLGHLHAAYGFCTQGFDVWLATDLVPGETARSVSEQDMVARRVPVGEWERMIVDGAVSDAASVAAWTLFRLGLDRL